MSLITERLGSLQLDALPSWDALVSALIVLGAGLLLLRLLTGILMRTLARGLREQSRDLIRKGIGYTGFTILFVMALNTAGVSVGALLGAAGVLGIAIGIASQASLSNMISGLFLVSERFFEIGDVIEVGEHMGTVQSIDLLSVKIRTFGNVLIRVPNQVLIEKDIRNITRFPLRRMDIRLVVPETTVLSVAFDALRSAVNSVPEVLEEPEPLVMFKAYRDNGVDLLLGVWFERHLYVQVRNAVAEAAASALHRRGIAIRTSAISVSSGDREVSDAQDAASV